MGTRKVTLHAPGTIPGVIHENSDLPAGVYTIDEATKTIVDVQPIATPVVAMETEQEQVSLHEGQTEDTSGAQKQEQQFI